MAVNKSASNFKSLIHCLIYTTTVLIFTIGFWYPHTSTFSIAWACIIFASHFPIDRWSLADKWLHLIEARSLKDFMKNGHWNSPKGLTFLEVRNYHMLRGGFTAIVYTVADNTMHLLLMWGGAQLCLMLVTK